MGTNDEGATPDDEGLDLEGALNGALDGLDSDDGTPPADIEASTADPDPDDDGEGADDDSKGQRERDENGRFVAKNKDDEPGDETPEGEEGGQEGAEAKTDDEPGEGEESDDSTLDENGHDITKAPTSWKSDAAGEFGKLPEAVRREVHKREEDFHRGIEQYRGAAQFGSDIAKEFQPYQAMLEQTKIAPSELVSAALKFEYEIRTGSPEQRAELIGKLANAYGVQLTQGESGEETDDNLPPDPRYDALLQELNGVKTKLTEREQREQDEQRRAEDAERKAIRDEIETFASDPKNEFYGQVKDTMLQLIKSGQGADLRDAYDKAIWINPVTRKTLLARQAKAERDKAAESAAAAKKANSLNVTPRATPPGRASGKGTMDESLNSALDEVLPG